MSLSPQLRILGLLLLSYCRAIPGLPVFAALGALCAFAGWLEGDPAASRAWLSAAICFLVAAPALFAGFHFRYLASRGSHALLPGFTPIMLATVLLLMLSLAGLTSLLATPLLPLRGSTLLAFAFCAWSALFWFGFLPTPLRLLLGFGAIAAIFMTPHTYEPGSALSQLSGGHLSGGDFLGRHGSAQTLSLMLLIASALGWAIFAVWFAGLVRRRVPFQRSDKAQWNFPLSLHWNAAEEIGSAPGSLLLGQGDSFRLRALRTLLGVLLIPLFLFALLHYGAGVEMRQLAENAVLVFVALTYAMGLFTHLALIGARRRPHLWLRGDWDMPGLTHLAEKVLWKEWLTLAIAWAALLAFVAAMGEIVPTRLLHLGPAWLCGLLFHLYIALWPRASDRWRKGMLFTHLLLLVSALAAERLGLDPNALLKMTCLQLAACLFLRQRGLAKARAGLGID